MKRIIMLSMFAMLPLSLEAALYRCVLPKADQCDMVTDLLDASSHLNNIHLEANKLVATIDSKYIITKSYMTKRDLPKAIHALDANARVLEVVKFSTMPVDPMLKNYLGCLFAMPKGTVDPVKEAKVKKAIDDFTQFIKTEGYNRTETAATPHVDSYTRATVAVKTLDTATLVSNTEIFANKPFTPCALAFQDADGKIIVLQADQQ